MPSKKSLDGTYRDVAHPINKETRSILQDRILESYHAALETMPEDDCGTSHIIEHSVLAGSVRYPVRDPFMEMIKSMVLSNLYNADMMTLPTYEAIDFWQSIKSPQTISVTPHYTGANGASKNGSAVSNATVIGLIHDRDAIGYTWLNPRALVTPENAAGAYYNEFYHARFATLSDNTEKGVVLCLD